MLCDVSNQRSSGLEDQINKPWRPLAAGRVTQRFAEHLLVALYIFCISFSFYIGVPGPSVALAVLLLGYNNLSMNKHWLIRNAVNAGGYVSFEVGATYLAGKGLSYLDHFSMD